MASLLRRVGVHYLESVEDAVQYALRQALEVWSRHTIPDEPSAWMFQVAYRQLMSELRDTKRRKDLLEAHLLPKEDVVEVLDIPLSGEMDDSLLLLLFITCHSSIPIESQLVVTLKSLCGFSVKEIALRLFISEANVYKRFSRAKQTLKKESIELDSLTALEMKKRLPMVQQVLYLVFTEGHLSIDQIQLPNRLHNLCLGFVTLDINFYSKI